SRSMHLFRSEKGLELNKYVEEQSDQKVLELLAPLDEANYQELVTAMKTIEKILYRVVPNELESGQ
ncbi:MarR family transcriptional regulator, partial [Enterococcus sp. S181_ASV_20]|nr:MarR family transcriptional regulator [Enterococcus sp. S181_ASV_20]